MFRIINTNFFPFVAKMCGIFRTFACLKNIFNYYVNTNKNGQGNAGVY